MWAAAFQRDFTVAFDNPPEGATGMVWLFFCATGQAGKSQARQVTAAEKLS